MGFVRFLVGAAGLCLALVIFPACSGDPGSSRGGGGGGGGGTGGVGGASDCGAVGVIPLECGDRVRDPIEACDDGNNVSCDGCSADCNMIEPGFRCPTVGALCVAIVCGDSRIDPPETCDDGPEAVGDGDGCSATCQREDGWECTLPGVACIAAECGDGIVAGFEQCDDGGATEPGCPDDCQLEDGYKCDTPGEACEPIECGDGVREGTEQCDDGNGTPFDGCGVDCRNEPSCSAGVCQPVCGDAVILPGTNEACDDGNASDGDGCSSTCQVEDGFQCVLTPVDLPDPLTIPVIYRDFRSNDTNDHEPTTFSWDFNNPDDSNGNIAFHITADFLDEKGKPELSGENPYMYSTNEGPSHSAASFAQWYQTSPTLDPTGNLEVVGELVLPKTGDNVYAYSSGDHPPGFFPLDDPALAPFAWPEEMYGETLHVPSCGSDPLPSCGSGPRNFGFTTGCTTFSSTRAMRCSPSVATTTSGCSWTGSYVSTWEGFTRAGGAR